MCCSSCVSLIRRIFPECAHRPKGTMSDLGSDKDLHEVAKGYKTGITLKDLNESRLNVRLL